MCEECGCRNQPEIDELSREHDGLLDQAYELYRVARRGSHADALAVIDDQFAPLLDHHQGKEEQGLFTQLRSRWAADDRLDTLIGEHRDLEAKVAAVRAGDDGWRELLIQIVDDLEEHILNEEVDLFPYAVYELQVEHWSEVARVHAAATRTMDLAVGG